MKSIAMELPVEQANNETNRTAWFGRYACVVHGDEAVEVFVSGLLIGSFAPGDIFTRNVLLVGLSGERNIKKGALAAAFDVSDEHRRRLCKMAGEQGMQALPGRQRGGSKPKIQGGARAKVLKHFAEGHRPVQVFRDHGKSLGVSYTTILRLHHAWSTEDPGRSGEESGQLAMDCVSAAESAESGLPSSEAAGGGIEEDEGVEAAPVLSGKHVQHLGGLLLVATIASYGLYDAALEGWTETARWRDRLRMAFDAIILALGLRQKCVEGVRRLETSTASLLLRTNRAPSESWVRRIIKRYVDGTGMATKLHLRMTGIYLNTARDDEEGPAVFYVDNHLRPYMGKFTLRKGWRMQDRRVVPGVTDYYVHDEDGRPVCRTEAPGHDSLTDFLSPTAALLRGGLGKGQRILLAFDRAGAFPNQMAELRDAEVEFVTYERRPYPLLSRTAFTEELKLDNGEKVWLHEERLKNLGNGLGRVRRICLLTEDGNQVNVLAVSKEPAWRLVEIITGRWVQENGFKHGQERWGINQLDRRKRLSYEPGTIIPNPARRRLDFSIRVSRQREGELRNKLARLGEDTPQYQAAKAKLEEQLHIQSELLAQRPNLPTHAPLAETELADELTYHDPHYKVVLDTIRIACLNAEAELADELAPHMLKSAEAKKLLANIFSAPGDLRVGKKAVTLNLKIAARKDERKAVAKLFQAINAKNLSLPGDPKSRPLRFKSDI